MHFMMTTFVFSLHYEEKRKKGGECKIMFQFPKFSETCEYPAIQHITPMLSSPHRYSPPKEKAEIAEENFQTVTYIWHYLNKSLFLQRLGHTR